MEDGVTEDHEQDRTEERDTTARPVTAAARRERRASARGETARRGVEDKVPAGKASPGTRPRRARPVDDDETGTKTRSKSDRGISTPKRDEEPRKDTQCIIAAVWCLT